MTKKLKMVLITSVLLGSFSCTYAGWFDSSYDKALAAKQRNDDATAVKLYEQSCSEGDMHGCFESGNMHFIGQGVQQDSDRANEFYTKACALKHSVACNKPKESKEFKKILNSCNEGNNESCGVLGSYYDSGYGTMQDYQRGYYYLERSCKGGSSEACSRLSAYYYNGKVVVKDIFKAFEVAIQACNGGVAVSCNDIGNLYRDGQGIRLDLTKAADFYGKACDMKNQQGCENYKQLKSPQPVQQVVNNNSNSNYQQEQLRIQRQQLKLQKEQNLQNQLNSMQQQNQFQSQQNAQYLRNLGY